MDDLQLFWAIPTTEGQLEVKAWRQKTPASSKSERVGKEI